ncbi:hypothetical protein N1851_032561 [Merluccius polli]|uniref:Uncharacterized protein n=1 Tax=Merluccius polli TaxID=89951 RepID=A0AA47M2X0_MERPO|nr:hypothetical protein N1851_032561 [Merluccius polli]
MMRSHTARTESQQGRDVKRVSSQGMMKCTEDTPMVSWITIQSDLSKERDIIPGVAWVRPTGSLLTGRSQAINAEETLPHPTSAKPNSSKHRPSLRRFATELLQLALLPLLLLIVQLKKCWRTKRLLKDISKLSPLLQTFNLEVLHSVIQKFAPNNVAFSYHGMLCRRGLLKETSGYVDEHLNLLFNEVISDPAPFVEELKAVSVPELLCSQYE